MDSAPSRMTNLSNTSMFAHILGALRSSTGVPSLQHTYVVIQERNLLLVHGWGVDGDFPGQMNLPDTNDPIRGLDLTHVDYVRNASPGQIIWLNI